MKYRFIVNPIAGRGEANKKWEEVKNVLESVNLDYESVFTQAPGDGVFLAKEGSRKGF